MAVKIRLARYGCKHRPCYRLVAAESRTRRDGKHLEIVGHYSPLPGKDGEKQLGLKFDRVEYWLSVGAQPSEPVKRILIRAGILPAPPMPGVVHKGESHDNNGALDLVAESFCDPESSA
ncbi:uncharacterized protein A4U43_C05F35420 [Asparagus officinalis]|uniref:30S ribosomal protein S16 n=1 Tax=Asparagus officinalis TaxID=4686 RepID=A0A5P1EWX6_ASPOF|nr:30S ribosomal protein S16-2, chloroplastic/mitochondrial-like [Asparagus officinalis]ONK70598.1 uncharacterized protein A4U43_C05F35420 [Asparagus officinalis]